MPPAKAKNKARSKMNGLEARPVKTVKDRKNKQDDNLDTKSAVPRISNDVALDAAVDAIPGILAIKDVHGVYLRCNIEFENFVGKSKAEIIGRQDQQIFQKKSANAIIKKDNNVKISGETVNEESWLTFANGYHGLFEVKHVPIKNTNRQIVGTLYLAENITQNRLLSSKIKRKEKALKALNEVASQVALFDFKTQLRQLLDVGQKFFDMEVGSIQIFDNDQVRVDVATRSCGDIIEGLSYHRSETISKVLLGMDENEVLTINYFERSSFYELNSIEKASGVKSYIATLMKVGDQVCGALNFMSTKPYVRTFTTSEIEFIQLLSRWISREMLRNQIQDNLQQAGHRTQLALEGANLGLWDWHVPTGQVVFNRRWFEMLGYEPNELDHTLQMIERMLHPDDKVQVFKVIDKHFNGELPVIHLEFRLRHKNGGWVWIEDYGRVMAFDEQGHPLRVVGTHMDITKRKSDEIEIKQLAFYDALTKLPNRRLLMDRLDRALTHSARNESHCALLFIDLDNFKTLNDTLGHDKGDTLLRQVADRLRSTVRDADTVSRLGGDEFVVMLEDLDIDDVEAALEAEVVAKKILSTLNQPYDLDDGEYFSTPSVGVTVFHGHYDSLEDVLKRADMAMYQAKGEGRNCVRFFDPSIQAVVNEKAALADDMRHGLRAQHFLLYFQPQVDIEGKLKGAEALLRWQHPLRGMVPPSEFIPLAEETGIILKLGKWVLEAGCRQLVEWSKSAVTKDLTLSINVSARQFHQPDFVSEVLDTIRKTGAYPRMLKLELTESMLAEDIEDIISKMTLLRTEGVRFSLDDFGTGFSSLSYLKRLPLNQLKIDQSFVRDVLTDPNDAVIACTIVALARSLGLDVIAEGVESEAQRDFLADNGCSDYQGYFFSRPLDKHQFRDYSLSLASSNNFISNLSNYELPFSQLGIS